MTGPQQYQAVILHAHKSDDVFDVTLPSGGYGIARLNGLTDEAKRQLKTSAGTQFRPLVVIPSTDFVKLS